MGPMRYIDMGGMFTVLKVRDDPAAAPNGWYPRGHGTHGHRRYRPGRGQPPLTPAIQPEPLRHPWGMAPCDMATTSSGTLSAAATMKSRRIVRCSCASACAGASARAPASTRRETGADARSTS